MARIVQVGAAPHNIVFKDFGIDADDTMVSKDGDSKHFVIQPQKAGRFEYVCTIHPATMKGTLTIT